MKLSITKTDTIELEELQDVGGITPVFLHFGQATLVEVGLLRLPVNGVHATDQEQAQHHRQCQLDKGDTALPTGYPAGVKGFPG